MIEGEFQDTEGAEARRAFSLQGTLLNPSPGSPLPNGGQGAAISISSNFDTNGLLWAVFPNVADASHHLGSGQLLVFNLNAANLNQPLASYSLNGDDVIKFTPPMVANGKVFVTTVGQTGQPPHLLVYGP